MMARTRGSDAPSSPRRGGGGARKRGCLARLGRAFGWLLLLGLLAASGLGAWGWYTLRTPRSFAGERLVEVPAGSGVAAILLALERADVIADAHLARVWLLLHGNPPLQAGEYQFKGPLTTAQALEKLIRGEVAAHRVTIVEGLTLEEIADRLAVAKLGDRDAFLALMRDPAPIHDLDPQATDLEGYLFPDSYSFAAGTPPAAIVTTLVNDFRRRWHQQVEPRLPHDGGRSVREIVTLASIVEKEAKLETERPLIAAVYANRLQHGMGLYADPTVIYALKKAGRWDGNITRADLQLDSPYNTYRRAGLPPGPICSPGVDSLLAAVTPADVPYLYFVAKNDGSHVFATTLEEHNHNVAIWQRRYWRERREHESEGAATPTPVDAHRPARR
jgi:UPF0755 protein